MKQVTPQNLPEAIKTFTIKRHSRPVDVVVSELTTIHQVLSTRTANFTARGLPAPFLALGTPISTILAEAEHNWLTGQFDRPELVKQWKERELEGEQRRDDLLGDMELALEDIPEAVKTLGLIRLGEGPEDMLDDLGALVATGKKYLAAAIKGGISETTLEVVEEFCADSKELFAKASSTPEMKSSLKMKRDQARTFAMEYLSIIRRYADQIYKYDEPTRLLFVSTYQAEANRARAQKEKVKREAEAVAQ